MRVKVPETARKGWWRDRESGGDRRAGKPATLTAPAPWLFLVRTACGVFIEFVRRSARGTAQFPFTLGRGVFPLISPDIAGRRHGLACGRHRVMLAAGDSVASRFSPTPRVALSPNPLQVAPHSTRNNFQYVV